MGSTCRRLERCLFQCFELGFVDVLGRHRPKRRRYRGTRHGADTVGIGVGGVSAAELLPNWVVCLAKGHDDVL